MINFNLISTSNYFLLALIMKQWVRSQSPFGKKWAIKFIQVTISSSLPVNLHCSSCPGKLGFSFWEPICMGKIYTFIGNSDWRRRMCTFGRLVTMDCLKAHPTWCPTMIQHCWLVGDKTINNANRMQLCAFHLLLYTEPLLILSSLWAPWFCAKVRRVYSKTVLRIRSKRLTVFVLRLVSPYR